MPRRTRHQDLDFEIHVDDNHASEASVDTSAMEDGHYDEQHDRAVDGGDSSSHHENEDDVFSDHSPRSSMGSASESDHVKNPHGTRSPRISDIQQYEGEMDYVPTVKGTPRPPFRSPSSVKAMQMSSPPASVMGTPRSGRRSALPTVSRLGSPNLSAQYSPKKTPPRFKRNTPPLVLLHVTLLPLRWSWGDVLDNAQTGELSEEAKTLREAWRQLQDRHGDTIQDRGILLPHPQNDFEMLEERLLEALELPVKRRARILECGHYIGPSNEMSFADEMESDEEDAYDDNKSIRAGMDKQTHWCTTCHSDIKCDPLGPGKIYRVKVYASNGLLKAGAWEACWKEMERVDVELEPVLESKVQDELAQFAAEQDKVMPDPDMSMHMQEPEEEEVHGEEEMEEDLADEQVEDPAEEPMMEEEPAVEDESMHQEEPMEEEHIPQEESIHEEEEEEEEEEPAMGEESFMARDMADDQNSSPQPEMQYDSTPSEEERRRMDEERYREMYGETPPSQHERTSMGGRSSIGGRSSMGPRPSMGAGSSTGFVPRETPPQPSAEAFEQPKEPQQPLKNATVPELLLEAFKVLMQDKKNIMIALLSVLTLMVALRGGGGGGDRQRHDNISFQTVIRNQEMATTTVTQAQAATAEPEPAVVTTTSTVVEIRYTPAIKIEPQDPCAAVQQHTVEKVKWLTQTVTQTEQATITHTETKEAETQPVSGDDEEAVEEKPVADEDGTGAAEEVEGEAEVEEEEALHDGVQDGAEAGADDAAADQGVEEEVEVEREL